MPLSTDPARPVSAAAFLEGHISIEAALRGGSRPIHRILVAVEGVRAERAERRIASLAATRSVPLQRMPRDEMDGLSSGRTHGGMLAEVGERDLVPLSELAVPRAFVVMLDGVEDPYNFGAAVRSLYAAGATGLVIRPRSWTSATAIVARASAGASELLPTAETDDPLEAVEVLSAAGLRVAIASERPDAVSLYDQSLCEPLFVLIGGERRGVARGVLDRADLLRIPYARGDAPSLGTAAAAAVIGFEVMRQRAVNAADATPAAPTPARATPRPGRPSSAQASDRPSARRPPR